MPTNTLLAGIRVLDLSRLLPGPFCTLYLAQLGAEVIKVEEPQGGDYARETPEMFALVNRGKKSVTLDLRTEADQARLRELVKDVDVLIESFRPGVMQRFGCAYEDLRRINPRLVYASLTGYGQDGPYRDWAGHDMNYLSIAGIMDQVGTAGGAPAQANVQIADLAGGALTTAVAILAAVIGARSSGAGTHVDAAMMDGSLALQVLSLSEIRAGNKAPRRGEGLLSGALPNYSVYRCRDGKYLAVGALEPKFFLEMLKGLGEVLPEPLRRRLAKSMPGGSRKPAGSGAKKSGGGQLEKLQKLFANPDRARYVTKPMRWALQAVFLTRKRDDWAALLAARDACVTPILSLEESLADPQVLARGMVEDDGGKPAFGFPVRFSAPLKPAAPAPELGQHNKSILGSARRR